MNNLQLGTIAFADPRSVWKTEHQDFTPWLAGEQNIAQLGEAIGLELEVDGVEVAAGPFFADILARDINNDRYVVIENQLNKTDHDHLGKAITYAAVLDATAIVWIACEFTEEHKKALDWLNENLSEDVAIYGVKLELWQIGESQKAPRFNVLCRPANEIKQSSRSLRGGQLSEVQQLQLRFWTEFRRMLLDAGRFTALKAPRGQYNYNVPIGHARITISNVASIMHRRIGIRIRLKSRIAESALAYLESMRQEIEAEIGEALHWDSDPKYPNKYISIYRDARIDDESQWPDYLQWMCDRTVRFRDAFQKRIRGQRFAESGEDLADEDGQGE